MASLKFRYIVVLGLLILITFVVNALEYNFAQDDTTGAGDLLQKVPVQVGNWHGQDLPLDKKVYEILETTAIIHRLYTDDKGNSVLLSIVHYFDTKVDFHAPESCLGGLGEKTEKKVKKLYLNINNKQLPVEIAEITASSHNNQSLSYYFYKTGKFVGQSYILLRLNIAKNKLTFRDSSASLIRVSSDIERSQEETAHTLNKFADIMFPLLIRIL